MMKNLRIPFNAYFWFFPFNDSLTTGLKGRSYGNFKRSKIKNSQRKKD